MKVRQHSTTHRSSGTQIDLANGKYPVSCADTFLCATSSERNSNRQEAEAKVRLICDMPSAEKSRASLSTCRTLPAILLTHLNCTRRSTNDLTLPLRVGRFLFPFPFLLLSPLRPLPPDHLHRPSRQRLFSTDAILDAPDSSRPPCTMSSPSPPLSQWSGT